MQALSPTRDALSQKRLGWEPRDPVSVGTPEMAPVEPTRYPLPGGFGPVVLSCE